MAMENSGFEFHLDEMELNATDDHRKCKYKNTADNKLYSFEEALDLTGNGFYNLSLIVVLSMSSFAMGCDMFGFSVVVTGATCDFQLNIAQTSLLLSMPFIGPIVMAYPWGYVSDTQGRRKSLLISLWGSCLFSSISAFSPNWIVLAVLKFFSTSFVSCVQSASYTLLGESCPQRVRDGYMIMMNSALETILPFYVGLGYGILNLEFSYDLGFVTFTPWRLLVLVLASTLSVAAFGVHFFYESPKFMLNAGHEEETLGILKKIHRRNGGVENYPVKRVYLDEKGNDRLKDVPLWRSLWEQIFPLFQPPLLWRSLQLFYLAFVVYGTSNSYFTWLPYLAQKFVDGTSSGNQVTGLCNLISTSYDNSTEHIQCSSKIELNLVWFSLAIGTIFTICLVCIARVAQWKRILLVSLQAVSGVCCIGAVLVTNNLVSVMLFFGTMVNCMAISLIYTFIVDLYPTSYRGMTACLGTMVARVGSLSGVNAIGAYVVSDCALTFIACGILTFVGVLVTFLLPPDRPRIK